MTGVQAQFAEEGVSIKIERCFEHPPFFSATGDALFYEVIPNNKTIVWNGFLLDDFLHISSLVRTNFGAEAGPLNI
jgi:hypothetical protein